jgi:zinc transporter 1
VWQLAGNRIVASAHIRCRNLHSYMAVAGKVKDLFHHEGIHSTTIQPEFDEVRLWADIRKFILDRFAK